MTDTDDLSLRARRILVVEDDFLLAQTLCEVLEGLGAVVVGPIGWLEEALSFVAASADAFDSALLDVNLHGEASYPIAEALIARNIGFVFMTGYGAHALDEPYRSCPRCEKPVHRDSLVAALRAVAAPGRSLRS